MKIKQLYKLFKLFKLLKSKDFILYIISPDKPVENIQKYYSSDDIQPDYQAFIFNDIKENLVNKIGIDNYSSKLQDYDNDLYVAYRDLEYNSIKAEYYETAYNYYKSLNDPNSGDANKTFMLYKHLLQVKDKFDAVSKLVNQ